jgi:hypothetical protein
MVSSGLLRRVALVRTSNLTSRYRLDLMGAQEVRWEGSGTVPAGEYTFLYGKGNEDHELVTGILLYIRESNQQLRGLSFLMIRCHT